MCLAVLVLSVEAQAYDLTALNGRDLAESFCEQVSPNDVEDCLIEIGFGIQLNGINNKGQVSGFWYEEGGGVANVRSFIVNDIGSPTARTFLPLPKNLKLGWQGFMQAGKINNAGQVVGTAFTSFHSPKGRFGYSYRDSTSVIGTVDLIKTFDLPGRFPNELVASNDLGDIAGNFVNSANTVSGFIWRVGTKKYERIDYPGAAWTWIHDINNRGDLIGLFYGDGFHAFLRHDGVFSIIDFPGVAPGPNGGPGTSVNGINNNGDVVGTYSIPYSFTYGDGTPGTGYHFHGFTLINQVYVTVDLNTVGRINGLDRQSLGFYNDVTDFLDINDRGQIVGQFDGFVSFVLTPQ